MNERILLVDDEPNVLAGYRRGLRKRFDLTTAESGAEGLATIRREGPFAVVVADMRMPLMDGVEFLAQVRETAPDTVRMMLTGNTDQRTAIDAVNEGQIFRFLNKPCESDVLAKSIEAGIEQHRLICAERELLELTLRGAVKVLTDVLGMVNPEAFGRATRVRRLAHQIAERAGAEPLWQIDLAAMLSQLGCITLPADVIQRAMRGADLSKSESRQWTEHPRTGGDLVAEIPRLEEVAEIIALQAHDFHGAELPLGARILRVALDFDALTTAGNLHSMAITIMRGRKGFYDPALMDVLAEIMAAKCEFEVHTVSVDDLTPEMTLAAEVRSKSGAQLFAEGQDISVALRLRLISYANLGLIDREVRVLTRAPREAEGDQLRATA